MNSLFRIRLTQHVLAILLLFYTLNDAWIFLEVGISWPFPEIFYVRVVGIVLALLYFAWRTTLFLPLLLLAYMLVCLVISPTQLPLLLICGWLLLFYWVYPLFLFRYRNFDRMLRALQVSALFVIPGLAVVPIPYLNGMIIGASALMAMGWLLLLLKRWKNIGFGVFYVGLGYLTYEHYYTLGFDWNVIGYAVLFLLPMIWLGNQNRDRAGFFDFWRFSYFRWTTLWSLWVPLVFGIIVTEVEQPRPQDQAEVHSPKKKRLVLWREPTQGAGIENAQ